MLASDFSVACLVSSKILRCTLRRERKEQNAREGCHVCLAGKFRRQGVFCTQVRMAAAP
jgi:hypothetical protein